MFNKVNMSSYFGKALVGILVQLLD